MMVYLLYLFVVIVISAVSIFKGKTDGLGIAVLIMFGLLLVPLLPGIVFTSGLWGFHTYIVWTNQSTNEYLKEQWKVYGMNPFRKNPWLNCWQILSYPAKKSFLSMRMVNYKKKYLDEISEFGFISNNLESIRKENAMVIKNDVRTEEEKSSKVM